MTTLPDFATFSDLHTTLDADNIREMIFEFLNSGQNMGHLSHQEMDQIINKLPRLVEKQIIDSGHQESVCPICFVPLLALLAEEETAIAMDSPAHPIEELGVTRLAEPYQCNHLFCRRDISRWIRDGHDSCPTCRRPLLERNGDTTNEASSGEDAYDPAQLQNILQRLQQISAEDLPEGLGVSTFPGFLLGTQAGRRNSNNNDRSDYNAMYS